MGKLIKRAVWLLAPPPKTPGASNSASMSSMLSSMLVLQLVVSMFGHVHAEALKCALTEDEPRKPRYLKFCQDYNDKACCIPGHDLEDQIQFEFLIEGLGPGCKNPMMYPNIRYFYCLGCVPDQPKYTTQIGEGDDASYGMTIYRSTRSVES